MVGDPAGVEFHNAKFSTDAFSADFVGGTVRPLNRSRSGDNERDEKLRLSLCEGEFAN